MFGDARFPTKETRIATLGTFPQKIPTNVAASVDLPSETEPENVIPMQHCFFPSSIS
jgi:hypothetical protein